MDLTPYELRVLYRLPPDVRNAVHAAANAHTHRKRHRKTCRALFAVAMTAVEKFAEVHDVRKEAVHRELVRKGLTPDFPDCDERWGCIPTEDRNKLNDDLDAIDLNGHALGIARSVLRRIGRVLVAREGA